MNKPELLSTIVRFRVQKNYHDFGYLGRQTQAWFLREVRRHDISLSDHLHNVEAGPQAVKSLLRPYTISTLYKGQHPARELRAGDWVWLRITSLTQPLSEFLTEKVLPELLPEAEFSPITLEVEQWPSGNGGSANTSVTTYAELMRKAIQSEERNLTLEFLSPTTFRQKNLLSNIEKDVPLPLPDKLFGSYISHWSAFSGAEVPDEYGEFLEECIGIKQLNIHSERVQFSRDNPRDAANGFLGQTCFTILGNKRKSRFKANWEHYANLTRMFFLFSFYCGSGRKTTRGLGQTAPRGL